MVGIKEELIEELEKLPEEEKDKPIIATLLDGQKTPREIIEELKKETPLGKRFIEGEMKRQQV